MNSEFFTRCPTCDARGFVLPPRYPSPVDELPRVVTCTDCNGKRYLLTDSAIEITVFVRDMLRFGFDDWRAAKDLHSSQLGLPVTFPALLPFKDDDEAVGE